MLHLTDEIILNPYNSFPSRKEDNIYLAESAVASVFMFPVLIFKFRTLMLLISVMLFPYLTNPVNFSFMKSLE